MRDLNWSAFWVVPRDTRGEYRATYYNRYECPHCGEPLPDDYGDYFMTHECDECGKEVKAGEGDPWREGEGHET